MTTLRNTIQSEYEEVRTNINERLGDKIDGCDTDGDIPSGQNAPGNSECLVIGKLIQFNYDSSDITISYVVAIDGTGEQYMSMGDSEALKGMILAKVGNSSSDNSFEVKTSDAAVIPKNVRLEWGGKFSKSWTIPPKGSVEKPKLADSLAILHSPVSGAVLVFSFVPGDLPINSSGIISLDKTHVNQPLAVMIENTLTGFKGGAICIDSGSSSVSTRSAVPADNFYDFEKTVKEENYVPGEEDLRSLCGIS
jgi:hypothetical protein